MDKRYILAVDQSTSATKVQLIHFMGKIVAKRSRSHRQYYPNPGWSEHDPVEIYRNVTDLMQQIVEQSAIDPQEIAAVSIANQRETAVVWDKDTGMPVYPAIVWQCRRTADACERWKEQGMEEVVRSKTGLTLDPYFSATKIRWILDHVEGAQEKAARGRLLCGTIDSWLIWKLTDGAVHATDYTNASRTMLFNIFDLKWDRELLELFGIPSGMLPQVKYSDEIFGEMEWEGLKLPISGVVGDSHGALLGQMCLEAGMVKATYGTGSSLLMNTGVRAIEPDKGLATTIAYAFGNRVVYALEGIIHSTGDTLKWMQDQLGLFETFQEAEEMAASLPDNDGVYVIPSFSGLGAPYWKPYMKASIIGMTRRSGKKHIIRAGMESIAYQVKDVLDLMQDVSGLSIKELRVDGGPTTNRFLMQFQADIAQVKVIRAEFPGLSSMGSAYLAGIGTGLWTKEQIRSLNGSKQAFVPLMDSRLSRKYYDEWKRNISLMVEASDKTLPVNAIPK